MTVDVAQTFTGEYILFLLVERTKEFPPRLASIMKKSPKMKQAKALDCSPKIKIIRPAGTHTAAETVKT